MEYLDDLEGQWYTWPQIVNFTEPSRFDRIHFSFSASCSRFTTPVSVHGFEIQLEVDTVGRLIVDEENKSANFFMRPNMFPYDTDRHFHYNSGAGNLKEEMAKLVCHSCIRAASIQLLTRYIACFIRVVVCHVINLFPEKKQFLLWMDEKELLFMQREIIVWRFEYLLLSG